MEPNAFAWVALLAWVPISLLAFARLSAPAALLFTVAGAELLLPVHAAFQTQGLPDMDREKIAILAALAGVLLLHRQRLRFDRPLLLAALALAPIAGWLLTARANPDPYASGIVTLPGMTLYDGVAAALNVTLAATLPFALGMALFRSRRDLHLLAMGLSAAALVYALPTLFELRMSPQLHNWVYGYFQHSWLQMMRGDGFRPIVFTPHALQLAMFFATAAVAAAALSRVGARILGLPALPVAGGFFAILVLSKSWAPAILAVTGLALVLLASDRARVVAAALLVSLVLLYPMLRATDLFPADALVETAARVDTERAGSLAFRFEHETILLEHARERIWTGWGGFGRNRIYSLDGKDASVTDGYWIIELGISGALGFATRMAVLVVPVFLAAGALRRLRSRSSRLLLSSFVLLIALRAVDQLPNASLTPFAVLICGAVSGLAVRLPMEERALARRRARARPANEPEAAALPLPAARPVLR